MLDSISLTIILTIIGILATYHVAHRQGAFRRKRFEVIFGGLDRRGFSHPWGLVLGVPECSAQTYVIALPILLCNRGSVPITNLRIQLSIPTERMASVKALGLAATLKYPPGRTATELRDRMLVDHTLEIVRPGETAVVAEPLVYTTEELVRARENMSRVTANAESCEIPWVPTDSIRLHAYAENLKPSSFSLWIAAMSSLGLDDLAQSSGFLAARLFETSGTSYLRVAPGTLVPKVLCLWSKRVLLTRLDCSQRVDDIAVDLGLKGREIQIMQAVRVFADPTVGLPRLHRPGR